MLEGFEIHVCSAHVDLQARHGGAWKPTFLMVRSPTFLDCVYIYTAGKYRYDKQVPIEAYLSRFG